MKDYNKKIYVAGHTGLVGSAIQRAFERHGYRNILCKTHKELELTNSNDVNDFFAKERPEWVVLAAAKVGGIAANSASPVEFLLENLKIQNNVIENAYKYNVEKLLFLGSSCIYPKEAEEPIKEDALLSGYLESTNEGYALAKICGIKLCNYYHKQYGANFMSAMPCNLYGVNDNYHQENAHVIPMLMRRICEAKEAGLAEVAVWGTGEPRREFLYSDDLADAVVFLMENKDAVDVDGLINIGCGCDLTIAQLAEMIKQTVGYDGRLVFDSTKPDGVKSKLLDVSKMMQWGWRAKTTLEDGLKLAYDDFLKRKYDKRDEQL